EDLVGELVSCVEFVRVRCRAFGEFGVVEFGVGEACVGGVVAGVVGGGCWAVSGCECGCVGGGWGGDAVGFGVGVWFGFWGWVVEIGRASCREGVWVCGVGGFV